MAAKADEPSALEAREAVRALVTRIVLTPVAVPSRKLSEVRIDLEGALAGLLHLAAGAKAAAAGVEFAAAVAERMLRAPDGILKGTDDTSMAGATPQNEEEPAPCGTASLMRRKTQGTLVAGAGFGHWLQLGKAYDL